MIPGLDHESVSSLLRAHVEGSLDDRVAAAVELHLVACRECEAERRALAALARADEPMTDLERARLRAAVRDATGTSATRRRPRWGARVAATIAAAALLVVVVGAGALFLGSGGPADEGAAVDAPGGGGPAKQRFESAGKNALRSRGERVAAASSPPPSAARPRFATTATRADVTQLRRVGRAGPPFVTYKQTYRAADAGPLERRYLELLGRDAPADLRRQVGECGRRVLQSQDYPVVAAYGARVELEGRRTLVLGFAWAPGEQGRLDRFQLWAWPKGQCDTPVSYQAGRIRG
jgi:hypothetical protein